MDTITLLYLLLSVLLIAVLVLGGALVQIKKRLDAQPRSVPPLGRATLTPTGSVPPGHEPEDVDSRSGLPIQRTPWNIGVVPTYWFLMPDETWVQIDPPDRIKARIMEHNVRHHPELLVDRRPVAATEPAPTGSASRPAGRTIEHEEPGHGAPARA